MKGSYVRIVSDRFLSIENLVGLVGEEFFACHSRVGDTFVFELAVAEAPDALFPGAEQVHDIDALCYGIQHAGGVCVSGGRIIEYSIDPPPDAELEIELSHPRAFQKKIITYF